MALSAQERAFAELLAECRDDPDLFNSAVLQRPPFWGSKDSPEPQHPGQVEWCRALVDYHTVAIETGNMLGKDFWIGSIVPWWLWTREHSLVIVMGPGQSVLGSVTWKEIRRAIEGCPFWPRFLPARMSRGIKTSPHVVEVTPGWQALGFSTDSIERASGQHAGDLLLLIEEASGLEDEPWEAAYGLGAAKMAAIGNPIRADGGFVRLCDQGDADARDGIPPHKAVRRLNTPSTASPHARLDRSPVGLASATWLEQEYRRWGKDSLWVLTHIKAVRPKVSSDVLIPEAWLDWAAYVVRSILPPGHPVHATRRIACDLGEGVGRDSSCVLVRDDWGVLDVVAGPALGLAEAAHLMWRKSCEWSVPQERITYDRAGIGKDFPLHLAREFGPGQRCQGYAGAGSPNSADFKNLRSEAAWKLRRRLEPGVSGDPREPHAGRPPFAIPPGPHWIRLREELRTLSYSLSGKKTALLKKEDHATLLGHSPDISDSLIQSFAFD